MRTPHLLGLAAGSVLAAGAAILVPSAAWAGPVATTATVATVSTLSSYTLGDTVSATIEMYIPDHTPIDGHWSMSLQGPGGSTSLVANQVALQPTAHDRIHIVDDIPVSAVGDYRLLVTFTPRAAIEQSSASGQATFIVRQGGVGMSTSHGALVAGKPGQVTATISLPSGSQPVGGTVRIDLGSTSGVASCAPARTSPTSAACTLTLPSTLAAGSYPSNVNWSGSPTFIQANSTGTIVITPAAKPGSGGGSGSGSGTGSGTTTGSAGTVAAAGASASPSPSSTASAAAATTGGGSAAGPAVDPSATSAAAAIDPLPFIVAGIIVLLAAGIIVGVVLLVRTRHARVA